jgi:hypothetical protein
VVFLILLASFFKSFSCFPNQLQQEYERGQIFCPQPTKQGIQAKSDEDGRSHRATCGGAICFQVMHAEI